MHQLDPFQDLAREIRLAARAPPRRLVRPGGEDVRPRLDGELVAGIGLEGKVARPPVVVDQAHGGLAPGGFVLRAKDDGRREHGMPFLEDVGGDHEPVPDLSLDGIPSVLEGGADVRDDDGASLFLHRQRSTR